MQSSISISRRSGSGGSNSLSSSLSLFSPLSFIRLFVCLPARPPACWPPPVVVAANHYIAGRSGMQTSCGYQARDWPPTIKRRPAGHNLAALAPSERACPPVCLLACLLACSPDCLQAASAGDTERAKRPKAVKSQRLQRASRQFFIETRAFPIEPRRQAGASLLQADCRALAETRKPAGRQWKLLLPASCS